MVKLRQLLRNTVIHSADAAGIRAVIGERCYPNEIATKDDPIYPCVNFEVGGTPLNNLSSVLDGPMRVWCWSSKDGNEGECWAMFDLLRAFWHNQRFSDATLKRNVYLLWTGSPDTYYDEEARVYGLITTWQVHCLVLP